MSAAVTAYPRIICDVKQLVLDLIPTPAPSFDNFVVGRNAEARNALLKMVCQSPPAKVIYLWGISGSGKTHCLAAVAAQCGPYSPATGVQSAKPPSAVGVQAADSPIVIVDDVDALDDEAQIGLFNAINLRANKAASCVLVAGKLAPRDLLLRPDLTSRLGSGLVYQLHPLTDAEKAVALNMHAASRGFSLPDDVINYLLRHSRRDMASLIAMLDALDHYSIETSREITLPLLRQLSQPPLV